MILISKRGIWDPSAKVSDHFTDGEFWCKCGQCIDQLLSTILVEALEDLRKACGNRPVKINSGYRCPAHNKAVGGATKSQHLEGTGADLTISGRIPQYIGRQAVKIGFPGIKVYHAWVHVDVREGDVWHVNV